MRQPDARRSVKSYRRLAKGYDASCMPVMPIREEAVALLELQRGDIVVDVASGTGLSFPLLLEAIGPTGRLIAIEHSPEMMALARARRGGRLAQRDADRSYDRSGRRSPAVRCHLVPLHPRRVAVSCFARTPVRPRQARCSCCRGWRQVHLLVACAAECVGDGSRASLPHDLLGAAAAVAQSADVCARSSGASSLAGYRLRGVWTISAVMRLPLVIGLIAHLDKG